MPQKETIVSLTTPEESSPQNETTTRLAKSEQGASETLTTSSTPMGDGQTDFRRESVVALVGSDVDFARQHSVSLELQATWQTRVDDRLQRQKN